MPHRFAVAAGQILGGRATLTGPSARQIARVLRLRPGHEVILFDEEGTEHTARLLRVTASRVEAAIGRASRPGRESPLRLTLAPALLRAPRMDLLVQKATELGVTAITPLLLARCVATGPGRLTRWRAIAREAGEQAGRTHLPSIQPPVPLGTFLAGLPSEVVRFALLQFLAGDLG
ncbi:MAG: 16S rRNA (uracil(1498)-N(3))-methyltransferase [candidate division NC10 bacterium]|nr:16S rRNA (uracil(1498)-N(3))-methyltransferase [candidate division NC10 bacterium]